MRKRHDPKYIRPESVLIGDTIKVSVQVLDMAVARVGQVKSRQVQGRAVAFYTDKGCELLVYIPGERAAFNTKVTLLDRVGEKPTELTGWTEMEPELG